MVWLSRTASPLIPPAQVNSLKAQALGLVGSDCREGGFRRGLTDDVGREGVIRLDRLDLDAIGIPEGAAGNSPQGPFDFKGPQAARLLDD